MADCQSQPFDFRGRIKQEARSLSRQIPQYDSGHYLYDKTFYFSTVLTEDSEQTQYSKILNLAQLVVGLIY